MDTVSRADKAKMWLMFLALAGFGAWFIHHQMDSFNAAPVASGNDAAREMDSSFAFGACEKAIKAAAKNPSSAVIPNRPNMAESGGYLFDWKRGDGLLLQNAFGAKIDTAATCIVSNDKQTVMALVIDGKRLIYRKPQ